MGSSQSLIASGVSLVVSIISAIIMVVAIGPPWDFIVGWLGEQQIGYAWSNTVMPLFGALYAIILLWVITSLIWFVKTAVARTEYTAEY